MGETDHELRNRRSLGGHRRSAPIGELLPTFCACIEPSRRSFARQADLFKTIQAQVSTAEAVFQLLRDMEEDLDTYLALSSPEPSMAPGRQTACGRAENLSGTATVPTIAAKRILTHPTSQGYCGLCCDLDAVQRYPDPKVLRNKSANTTKSRNVLRRRADQTRSDPTTLAQHLPG